MCELMRRNLCRSIDNFDARGLGVSLAGTLSHRVQHLGRVKLRPEL